LAGKQNQNKTGYGGRYDTGILLFHTGNEYGRFNKTTEIMLHNFLLNYRAGQAPTAGQ
jgi:hypothetical protein